MKRFVFLSLTCLLVSMPVMAEELLQGDEQSFETGITPGRWEQFTWPCVYVVCPWAGGNNAYTTGVLHPTLVGGWTEGPDGNPVDYLHHDDAAPGWGSKCLGIIDLGDPGWDFHANTGGIMITLDVVNGATYTISGYVKFATGGVTETGWRSAGGISVDTDGGTDAGALEYGHGYQGVMVGDILIGSASPADTGDAIWNQEGMDPGDDPIASNEEIWWGPSNFTLDIAATGDQMTIFLWGLNKFRSNIVQFDGISVDGEIPVPPTPSTGVREPEWSAFR